MDSSSWQSTDTLLLDNISAVTFAEHGTFKNGLYHYWFHWRQNKQEKRVLERELNMKYED